MGTSERSHKVASLLDGRAANDMLIRARTCESVMKSLDLSLLSRDPLMYATPTGSNPPASSSQHCIHPDKTASERDA